MDTCAPGSLTPLQMEGISVAGGRGTLVTLSLHFYGEGEERLRSVNSTPGPPPARLWPEG